MDADLALLFNRNSKTESSFFPKGTDEAVTEVFGAVN